eukprot:gb/GEZJ01003254.1/.p2 GENE.gb/GEZJ01003254.1/~~gb/GEZJ01003254.1/.p2  ORF type:complete len:227 (+),score=26.51 gb/GEZJ01003254.1/:2653-3333(+)
MQKTASTTISRALSNMPHAMTYPFQLLPDTNILPNPNPTADRFYFIALQHMPYNLPVRDTFLKVRPNFVLSSIRHPTDRAISSFRQQINQFECVSEMDCPKKEQLIITEFDKFVDQRRMQASQFFQLQERSPRLALRPKKLNITRVVSQLDFIFLQERLQDSFECFCKTHGVHLCDSKTSVKRENAKKKRACVEHVFMQHRFIVLSKGYEQDFQILKWFRSQLDTC